MSVNLTKGKLTSSPKASK